MRRTRKRTISRRAATLHLEDGYSALHAEEKEDFKAILMISSFFDSEIPDALNEGRQGCLHIGFAHFCFLPAELFLFPFSNFRSPRHLRVQACCWLQGLSFPVLASKIGLQVMVLGRERRRTRMEGRPWRGVGKKVFFPFLESRKVCKKHQNDEDLLPSLTHWRP